VEDKKTIKQRYQSPTPKFFKKLAWIGGSIAAAGLGLITAPVALPAVLITVAGYMVTGGTVMTIVAKAVTTSEK